MQETHIPGKGYVLAMVAQRVFAVLKALVFPVQYAIPLGTCQDVKVGSHSLHYDIVSFDNKEVNSI